MGRNGGGDGLGIGKHRMGGKGEGGGYEAWDFGDEVYELRADARSLHRSKLPGLGGGVALIQLEPTPRSIVSDSVVVVACSCLRRHLSNTI